MTAGPFFAGCKAPMATPARIKHHEGSVQAVLYPYPAVEPLHFSTGVREPAKLSIPAAPSGQHRQDG
ncbi:hypothetical protein HaLaN_26826 [Haematococcus lacustris]|uniref:Uncharacterized protein n=1 Tax=Haematococcus lacustris TaxID=44745 RepID=A0A6A0A6Z2_HAELA|nr:hypothetical protein HaLaN_26826 [Haematococcus lacustris]